MVWTLLPPSSGLFLFFAVLAGCGGETATEGEVSALTQLHAEDPAGAAEQLADMDALGRIAAISELVDGDPQGAAAYCSLLPHSMSRARCEYSGSRTHLWAQQEDLSPVVRAGRGPGHSGLAADDVPISDWAKIRSTPPVGVADPQAQAWSEAKSQAESGPIEDVAQACAQLRGGERWRHDCFFFAAQRRIQRLGRAGLADAYALCGASGDYRGVCVVELIDGLAAVSPPSDVSDPLTWAPVLMRAHDLRALVDDARLRAVLLDRFWSRVALHSVYGARGLSGDAMDITPRAAHPHFRAALAHRVVESAESDLSLIDAQRLINTVMARRISGSGAALSGLELPEVSDLWPADGHGESHIAAISHMGVSRRTVANDPTTDVAICVLEAAARTSPPRESLLRASTQHSDQRVRWTAARLIEQLGARELGVESPSQSPSPDGPN